MHNKIAAANYRQRVPHIWEIGQIWSFVFSHCGSERLSPTTSERKLFSCVTVAECSWHPGHTHKCLSSNKYFLPFISEGKSNMDTQKPSQHNDTFFLTLREGSCSTSCLYHTVVERSIVRSLLVEPDLEQVVWKMFPKNMTTHPVKSVVKIQSIWTVTMHFIKSVSIREMCSLMQGPTEEQCLRLSSAAVTLETLFINLHSQQLNSLAGVRTWTKPITSALPLDLFSQLAFVFTSTSVSAWQSKKECFNSVIY